MHRRAQSKRVSAAEKKPPLKGEVARPVRP